MDLNRTAARSCRSVAALVGVIAAAAFAPVTASAQSVAPIPADARIVTLGSSVTETVFALGFGDQVVAVDESSLYPASVGERPQVGYYRTLSAEGLLSLRPDVIIGAAASGPPPVLAMVEAAGVRVELIEDAHHPDEIPANVLRIAGILGVPERGEALAAKVRADFERVAAMRRALDAGTGQPSDGGLSAVFVWNRGGPGLQVAGHGTGAHTMLEVAGIRNAAAALEGYQPFNAEAMLLANPDLLIVPAATAEGLGGLDALLGMPGVAATAAARTGNVVTVDLLAFIGFGPRAGDALAAVVEATQQPAPAEPRGHLPRR